MVFMNLFWAPIWLFTIHRMGRQEDSHTRQERYDYIARMVKRIIRYGRVNLVIKGQENIPDHDGFIIFPNHQGLFDMLALFASCPRPLSVVIKKEAANWILVKDVLAATRSLSMDREDIKSQVKVISEVGKRVKAGENFVIFAEGHRSRKGNEILEFKSGTFKSATKASCTIVPVALINSFRPFDINSLKRETVEVHYLKPIDLEEYFSMNTAQIAQMVQNRIEEEIKNTLASAGVFL